MVCHFRSIHFSRITYCTVESDGGHESHEGYDGNESNESCVIQHQCQPLALISGGLPKHFRAGAGFQVVPLARGALKSTSLGQRHAVRVRLWAGEPFRKRLCWISVGGRVGTVGRAVGSGGQEQGHLLKHQGQGVMQPPGDIRARRRVKARRRRRRRRRRQ